jgi:hypothetical protein
MRRLQRYSKLQQNEQSSERRPKMHVRREMMRAQPNTKRTPIVSKRRKERVSKRRRKPNVKQRRKRTRCPFQMKAATHPRSLFTSP